MSHVSLQQCVHTSGSVTQHREVPARGSASKAGTTQGQIKAPKSHPVKPCGASQTCSVQQEVSISDCFTSKMSLPDPVPAQMGLYSQLLHQVSSANLAAGGSEHSSACPWVGPPGCCCCLTLNILLVWFLPFTSSSARASPASEILLSLQPICN